MGRIIVLVGVLWTAMMPAAEAEDHVANLRGPTSLAEQPAAPAVPKVEEEAGRRQRSYPEQPPTIPHSIRDYQVDLHVNKCLACHDRRRTGESQAPMVSITHFMDRDGQTLATVSPRRYFCGQCHVVQHRVKPLVGNDFTDVDSVITKQ